MADTRNTVRIKKYGVCLYDKCDNYKVIQEIVHDDWECPVCHKKLSPCAPPKQKSSKKPLYIGLASIVVIGGILAFVFAGGGKTGAGNGPDIAVVDSDSIRAAQQAEQQLAEQQRLKDMQDSLQAVADSLTAEQLRQDSIEKARQDSIEKTKKGEKVGGSATSKTKNLGYATFYGTWPNDVNGRMTFKASHLIDSRDPKSRVAEAGDYVIGEWSDGHLVQGIWYGSDNVVKGSIIIGK